MTLTRTVLLAGAVASIAACSSTGRALHAGRHPWTHPGELRIATSLTPNTLNPLLSTQAIEGFAAAFALEGLVGTDGRGHDVPILAREVPTQGNGGISRDGLTLTYHLRRGVRWQDGAPFDSRDVAFSFAAIMNPRTNVASRHGYDAIARVRTPDAQTVVVRLKHPFAPAVETFFAASDQPYAILPAHLLARYADLNHVPYNERPVGTGPFRVVRWVRGDRIEYEANPRYYRGAPKLRRVVLRFVPDENTLVNQMRAHEVDYFPYGSPRVYPQLSAVDGLRIPLVPINGNDAVMLNTRRAPFDDVRVRRALGLAIDKRRLVDEVTFRTTLPATEDLPSFLWAFDPAAGTTKRDLPRARGLLDAAGWHVGRDGVRVRGGRRLSIGLAYLSDSATDRQRSVLIAAMLRDAGFETDLKGYRSALLYGGPGVGVLADGRFDAALQTWYAGTDPDDSTQLTCDQVAPHGYNWARYCSAEMDAAQRDALGHYDRPTRKAAYARIERLLARDAPFVYLWWPRQIEAVNSDLRGFSPNGIVDPWNAWEWSI